MCQNSDYLLLIIFAKSIGPDQAQHIVELIWIQIVSQSEGVPKWRIFF